jgi:hypothetical protein
MMMDIDQAAQAMRDEEMLAEIEDFIEGFNQPTYAAVLSLIRDRSRWLPVGNRSPAREERKLE